MSEVSLLEAIFALVVRGGWVMAPIFVVGWVAWVLLLERFWAYWELRGPRARNFWKTLEKEGLPAARIWAEKKRGLLPRLLHGALLRHSLGPKAVRNEMECIRYEAEAKLASHLKTIAVMAAVAPLLGLLGTVSGMVHTFEVINQFGFGNPVLLADGISEALLTTQAGLLVAFPIMIAYNHLLSRLQRLQTVAWSEAVRFELWLERQGEVSV
jgi:biopolymer transport protein ExbB